MLCSTPRTTLTSILRHSFRTCVQRWRNTVVCCIFSWVPIHSRTSVAMSIVCGKRARQARGRCRHCRVATTRGRSCKWNIFPSPWCAGNTACAKSASDASAVGARSVPICTSTGRRVGETWVAGTRAGSSGCENRAFVYVPYGLFVGHARRCGVCDEERGEEGTSTMTALS